MVILVLSCDKDEDTFEAFHHCIEKYYPNHPEIIYATETIKNPYYKTICVDYPVELWTKRIRETLKQIDDNVILTIMDDDFIRKPVDTERIEYLSKQLKDNIAAFYFEKSFDKNDEDKANEAKNKEAQNKIDTRIIFLNIITTPVRFF